MGTENAARGRGVPPRRQSTCGGGTASPLPDPENSQDDDHRHVDSEPHRVRPDAWVEGTERVRGEKLQAEGDDRDDERSYEADVGLGDFRRHSARSLASHVGFVSKGLNQHPPNSPCFTQWDAYQSRKSPTDSAEEVFFEHDPAKPPRPAEACDTWRGIIAKGGHGTRAWRPVTPAMVSDGLSSTVAILEKACAQGSSTADPRDWWELPGWAQSADWSTMRIAHVEGEYPPVADATRRRIGDPFLRDFDTGRYKELAFGSPHPDVMLGVFGDGATRPIRLSIDPWVFHNLGCRDDGEVIRKADLE